MIIYNIVRYYKFIIKALHINWIFFKKTVLNRFIFNNYLGCYLYVFYHILKSYFITLRKLTIIHWPLRKIYTRNSFAFIIKSKQKKKRKCQILCSGQSILETIKYIDNDDYVIGFNFSGLIFPKGNLHFFSYAKFNSGVPTIPTKMLIKMANNMIYESYLWTNISNVNTLGKDKTEEPFDYEIVKNNFPNNSFYILDAVLPAFNSNYSMLTDCCVDISTSKRAFFLSQYMNSLATILSFCSVLPFEEIIIHGCDIVGKRFYNTKDFVVPEYTSRNELVELDEYHKLNYRLKNDFSVNSLAFLLPIFSKYLRKRGKHLYSASSKTGASKYIPSFY